MDKETVIKCAISVLEAGFLGDIDKWEAIKAAKVLLIEADLALETLWTSSENTETRKTEMRITEDVLSQIRKEIYHSIMS